MKQCFLSWLRLVRAPNLFTVPGDPLMGLAAATLAGTAFPDWERMAGVAFSAICLYAAGLILNDLHDRKRDARRRPERPLPSGQVSVPAAIVVMFALVAAGLVVAHTVGRECLLIALMLVAAIAAYDLFLKDFVVPGALAMGLCRGLSVLLGVPFAQWAGLPLALASSVTLYVVGLTLVSRGEDQKLRYGVSVWIPPLAVLCGGAMLAWGGRDALRQVHPTWLVVSLICVLTAVALSARLALKLRARDAEPATARSAVGLLIRQLPLIQCAMLVLVPATAWLGVVLAVLALLVVRPLAKRISGA